MTKLRLWWEQLVGWLTHDQARVEMARGIERNENYFTVYAGSMRWLQAAQLVAATMGLSTSLDTTEGKLRVQGNKIALVRFSRVVLDPPK